MQTQYSSKRMSNENERMKGIRAAGEEDNSFARETTFSNRHARATGRIQMDRGI
jgi:hypothetical protein